MSRDGADRFVDGISFRGVTGTGAGATDVAAAVVAGAATLAGAPPPEPPSNRFRQEHREYVNLLDVPFGFAVKSSEVY